MKNCCGNKVSIIIPLYNSEKYIAETINSALNQTWENKEIIIIDDGSTDKSLVIAKSYERVNVIVISQQNKGASAARNVGIKNSKGDFIQFLDADDLLSTDKIEAQMKIFEQYGNDIIVSCQWDGFIKLKEEAKFPKRFSL
jgi:glycosyltransferase involved in cell wall biosynthesis